MCNYDVSIFSFSNAKHASNNANTKRNFRTERNVRRCNSSMSCFESLGLAEWLVRQVSAMGFKEPTSVQAHCIPPILEGKTVVAIHGCRSSAGSTVHVVFLLTRPTCFTAHT